MFSSTNPLGIESRLNLDLHTLDNWAKQWLVDFKPKKTEYTGVEIELFNKWIDTH
jgi:hypothetical protein